MRKVYLQGNKLEKLQSSVGRCEQLEVLNVENNMIKGVAKRIGQLPKLRHLLLAGNQLASLPFNPLETAPGLRRLTLTGNKLSAEVMELEKLTIKDAMNGIAEDDEF